MSTFKHVVTSFHGKYIKSIVYGGLDGIVTTFAVVAGASGASLNPGVILILGFANLIGDGISMAFGDYVSSRSENEYKEREKAHAESIFDNDLGQEKQCLINSYVAKGFVEQDAQVMVTLLAGNKDSFIAMTLLERGIGTVNRSPFAKALYTFFSFIIFGFVPLLVYLVAFAFPCVMQYAFVLACALTGFTLFFLGAMKVKVTGKDWFRSGLEMLGIGSFASLAAYAVGHLLAGFAGQ
ncbi:VIT1/CCC1 transporter family protein [Candidatus Babeliales bacterium]|nr:VIT1/CCC1 transporter family protein [Candidatus Babeliales bacterium]